MVTDTAIGFGEGVVVIVHPHVVAVVLLPVFSHRADLDAAPARGQVPVPEFFRPACTGMLIGKVCRVTAAFYSRYGAGGYTTPATDAEGFL